MGGIKEREQNGACRKHVQHRNQSIGLANYFARLDMETRGLKRPSLGPSGPKLLLRVACVAPKIGIGVAGAATVVAHPDGYPFADGVCVCAHADGRVGDSAAGMLPFRIALRSSSLDLEKLSLELDRRPMDHGQSSLVRS